MRWFSVIIVPLLLSLRFIHITGLIWRISMADFITLVCESCGGKLHLTEQVNHFVCPYCGHEHIVKKSADGLMSNCACPVCSKDDQVQKLSSIVSSGTNTKTGISRTTQYTDIKGKEEYYTRDRKYAGKGDISGNASTTSTTRIETREQSELATLVSPPPRPAAPEVPKFGLFERFDFLKIMVMLIFGVLGALLAEVVDQNNEYVATAFFVVAAGLAAVGYSRLRPGAKSGGSFSKGRMKKEMAFAEAHQLYKEEVSSWEEAMQRWEGMYFCHRDDVVFVPGEYNFVRPGDVISYSYQ
jgi:predicted RNA-binding Zn-ribbon protein involved in translation (DUF1610 family)